MSPWVSISLVWTGRSYQRINSILTLRSLITAKAQEKNRGKENEKRKTKQKPRHISNIIASVSWYHPAWLQITPLHSVWSNGWLGLMLTLLLKMQKKTTTTTKHIFINIQCHGGVIDSIINQVIFVASIGTSNSMTSIISPLKLRSLYSPLRLSNTLNHFSWEVFFFLTCCFSASPKSNVTSNSLTLYVGHLK